MQDKQMTLTIHFVTAVTTYGYSVCIVNFGEDQVHTMGDGDAIWIFCLRSKNILGWLCLRCSYKSHNSGT